MDTGTVWWILAGVAVFALGGKLAVDEWEKEKIIPLAYPYFGVGFVPALHFSVDYIGLSWLQLVFWIPLFGILGLLSALEDRMKAAKRR